MKILITEHQHESLLNEGVEDIKEIIKLSRLIMDRIITHITPNLHKEMVEYINNTKKNIRFIIPYYFILQSDTIFKDIESEFSVLKDFIRDFGLAIHIHDNFKNIDTDAVYKIWPNPNDVGGTINIRANFPSLNNSVELALRSDKEKVIDVCIKILSNKWMYSLSHELQHAYDDYRSMGKFTSDKSSIEYYKGHNIKNDEDARYVKYLNLPHEYWARLTNYINTIDKLKFTNFNALKRHFSYQFEGYDYLSDNAKKRILKVLYKYWNK